jgi:hypothetical protein
MIFLHYHCPRMDAKVVVTLTYEYGLRFVYNCSGAAACGVACDRAGHFRLDPSCPLICATKPVPQT